MTDRYKIRVDGYDNMPSHIKSFLREVKNMGFDVEKHSLYYDETYKEDEFDKDIVSDETESYLSLKVILDAEKLARGEYHENLARKYPVLFDTLGMYYGIEHIHTGKKIENEESLAKKILPEVKKFIKTLENNRIVHSVRWSKSDTGDLGEIYIVFKNVGSWTYYDDKKRIVDKSEKFLNDLGYIIKFKRNF